MKTPEMIHGTVEMVSVEWIMQNATSSVDGFEVWDEPGVDYAWMVRDKGSDSHFGDIVQTIMERGFRLPIVLSAYGNAVVHGNGHHRMVAAILLCLDEIPVFWDDGADYMRTNHTEGEDLIFGGWDDLPTMVYDECY